MGGGASIDILHVDDEHQFASMTADMLEQADERFSLETATDASEGLEKLTTAEYDCIVSDYDMPGQNGLEFLTTVRGGYPDLPFILYTGKGSEEVASDAIAAGVTGYLQKEGGTSQYTVLANRIRNAVEKYRAQRRLAERERRLEQILKTVPACVVQLNPAGEFVFANDRAEEVLGLEADDVTERTYNDPEWNIRDLDGDPIPDEDLPFRKVCDTGEPLYDARHIIEWPDRTQKILLVNGAPVFDEHGVVDTVIFALTDVTDRVIRQRRIEALLENTTAPLFMKNRDGEYLLVNQGWKELFGVDGTEVRGQTDEDLFAPEMAAEVQANDQEVFDTGERLEREETIIVDGEERTFLTSKTPVYDTGVTANTDTPVALFGVANDITEQKNRERRLQRQTERFDELARAISHDLQTPLETARGRAELAIESGDVEQMERALDAIERTSDIRENIADLLQTQEVVAETEPIDIERSARAAAETLPDGDDLSLRIQTSCSVDADADALRRLFENLFRNALEHGDDDITVSIGRTDETLVIEDDGPGIPEETRTEVFAPGYSTKPGGSGLGLASVRQIALAHGWEIQIAERSGGGTRLEFGNVEFVD